MKLQRKTSPETPWHVLMMVMVVELCFMVILESERQSKSFADATMTVVSGDKYVNKRGVNFIITIILMRINCELRTYS